jgi:hypothetical protein
MFGILQMNEWLNDFRMGKDRKKRILQTENWMFTPSDLLPIWAESLKLILMCDSL